MVRYCKQDVRLLEGVFDVMSPYLEPVSSVAKRICDCPECGSGRTVVRKEYRTKAGHDRVNFVCLDCKQPHTVAKSRFDKAKRDAA
jgi:transposase-like protein